MSNWRSVTQVIETWVPRKLDPAIRDQVLAFVRPIVAASKPPTPASAKNRVRDACGLAAWCLSVGLDLDSDAVFAPSTVERYLRVGLADASEAVHRTATPNIRKLARTAAPRLQPLQPGVYSQRAFRQPYELDEIESYVRLARQQSTQMRRTRLESLVCLGAGAGLMPGEFQSVQTHDVRRRGESVVVNIVGVHARSVPVLEPLGEYLLAIAGELRPGAYLLGGSREADRRNQVAKATNRVHLNTGLPRLQISRLRATWLSHHLHAIGFDILVAGAGVKQTPSFFDLIALSPVPSTDAICEWLKGELL